MVRAQKKGDINSSVLKLAVLLIVLLIGAISCLKSAGAQTVIKDEDVVAVADEMPNFPGGTKALISTVYNKINYPEDAIQKRIEGKVVVRFIVTKDGDAVQPSISKGLFPSIDDEVIRVIKKLPKFTPGKLNGQPVNVWYAIPITFKLS